MLVNLRGSHGSGKTWVSHKLVLDHEHEGVIDPEYCREKHFIKPNCFIVEGGLNVVGRWKSGMDGIFPQEIIEDMIEYWAPKGHVVWENVMISANVGRWCVLAHKLEPINHSVWMFLDTPLELCIERVFERRRESSGRGFSHRQEDFEVKLDVLGGHWRRCRRAAVRAAAEGIDVRWTDHTQAYEQVNNMLVVEGGWNQPYFSPNESGIPVEHPKRWEPTPEEQEYVLKTAKLPWEPDDTVTKVAFTRPNIQKSRNAHEGLGAKVRKWGVGLGDTEELGTIVKAWKVATESTLPQSPSTLNGEVS